MSGLAKCWWEDFGTAYSHRLVDEPEIRPLTRLCIQAVACKAIGDALGASKGFAEISQRAAAELFPWAFDVDDVAGIEGLDMRFAEFNEQWPIDDDFDEDEYASDFWEEFSDAIPLFVRAFATIDWSAKDFRYLSKLSALSGETEMKAILFTMLSDPRLPAKLVGNWITEGDGALDLQYGLALNSAIDSKKSWQLLEERGDDSFAIVGTRDDLDWLVAARPQTTADQAKRICKRLVNESTWRDLSR